MRRAIIVFCKNTVALGGFMLRRIVILTMLLALVLAAVPASAASLSRQEAMRSTIQNQYDAYARELNYSGVHEDAIKQLQRVMTPLPQN